LATSRALAVLLTAAACQSSPAVDEASSEIVGGTVDLADDAVVGLTYRARPCGTAPVATCTGTLIAPRAVLTAAHCVDGESAATLLVFSGPRADGGARVEIDSIEIHPDFDGLAADLAIVTLAAPLAAAPLPLRRAPLDAAAVGTRVRLVGYGASEAGAEGIKHEGTARITQVTAASIVVAPDPALTCNADSGGPVLIAEEVAGVVAYGDPACATSGTSTRADLHVDSFVAPALARIAAGGPASRPPRETSATCTACASAEDCPRGSDCVGGTCGLAGSEHGAAGAECSADGDCARAPCLAGLEEIGCRCLVTCDDPGGCGCGTSGSAGSLVLVALVAGPLLVRRRR